MKRLVFHVDVNSAFLSWEAVRILNGGGEDIRLIPSAVGGDRDKRTGVILAKSIPAKKFGIKTGEPVARALSKCPSLKLFKPDFNLYVKNSEAFIKICERYAPVVEQVSIDECFLDMSGTEKMYGDPVAVAYEIKDTIKRELGFTVNVGIGENKILAKTASDFSKPDKVHTLFLSEIREKLWPMPVKELYSVGAATAERLTAANIRTIKELAEADLIKLKKICGNKLGEQLKAYANGIDDSPVLSEKEDAKCYGVSVTLENDVVNFTDAEKILLALADSVSSRMRKDGAEAYCIGVTVRDNNFKNKSHQKKLSDPTDLTDEIIKTSKLLFSELWDKKTPLRLLGITLSDIVRGGAIQQSIFGLDGEREKSRKRDEAVDFIRKKFGMNAINRGTLLGEDTSVGKKYRAELSKKEDEE